MATRKIAMVLAGCGNKDGSEITEAISCIIALSRLGADLHFFAPNIDIEALDFLTNQSIGKRNLLSESARITRSQIFDLQTLDANQFDGIILPGGFGAAAHMSSWPKMRSKGQVIESLDRILKAFHSQSKPIAAICIAPILVALSLGANQIEITLGPESEVSVEARKTGAIVFECPVNDYVTDRLNKIITTPAYMYDDAKAHQVFAGIEALCQEFLEMS